MEKLDEIKTQILKEASESPGKFFPVEKFREREFVRKKCGSCGRYFWTKIEGRERCGEAECSGGYSFIDNPPTDRSFDYTSAWTEFRDFMERRGYTGINRYPVLARWRDDTDFVRASIYDFQPHVVSGEVEPPANPLVVPQFCLRFNDIDNVGITGGHYTGFIMTVQHSFDPKDSFNQEKYFEDMLDWLTVGMGIEEDQIILHEDAWAGGGNLGGCVEFFVGGMELLNQVYITHKISSGGKGFEEIDTGVLDMGMGHERIVWISQGSKTSYEANMPYVVGKLYDSTGIKIDKDMRKRFLPYSGLLNADEVDDLDRKWEEIADKIGENKDTLREEIETAAALYSVVDHTRTLLVAFVDGALPSNTGEKHSLRIIARRAMDFIDKYDWNIRLEDVMEWHAEELQGLFPEIKENLEQAKRIIRHEERKYEEMMEKAGEIIDKLDEDEVDEHKLVELYDTHGISPELLRRSGLNIRTPQNFYSMVSEKHEDSGKKSSDDPVGFDLKDVEDTEKLYIKDEKTVDFEAKVLDILKVEDGKYVVLDRTCFYPTQGGQVNDTGTINGSEVLDTINKGGIILHKMKDISFSKGERVKGHVNWERRKQLMQHHTATHIINGAAAKVLGSHVSQSGASKTETKARLDITHYENLTREEMGKIENLARSWIEEDLEVKKTVMKKSEAEKRHGFKIYQGGVPPGNELRIIEIGEGIDVEACGGTHVDSTSEVEDLVLIRSTKVQDGVIRLEFKSGAAARDYRKSRAEIRERLGKMIDTEGYTLEDIGEIFNVSPEDLVDVVDRFTQEWEEKRDKINKLREMLGTEKTTRREFPNGPKELFDDWKEEDKEIEKLEGKICKKLVDEIVNSDQGFVKKKVPVKNMGNLINTARSVVQKDKNKAVLIRGENSVVAMAGSMSEHDIEEEVRKEAEVVKKTGDIFKGFKLK